MLRPRARREFPDDVKKRVEIIREKSKKLRNDGSSKKGKEQDETGNDEESEEKDEAREHEAICERDMRRPPEHRSNFTFPSLPDFNLTIQKGLTLFY
jgi:hypothetical protein